MTDEERVTAFRSRLKDLCREFEVMIDVDFYLDGDEGFEYIVGEVELRDTSHRSIGRLFHNGEVM